MRLDSRVALISGGATGIGAATARRFVAEGAKVMLADLRADEGDALRAALEAGGGEAGFVELDVREEAAWEAAVSATEARFGALHILVNNAGIFARRRLIETTVEDFDRMMAVNARGVFLGAKAAVPTIARAGGGAIVNLSSIAGLVGGAATGDYNASKGAVRLMTKSLAIQHAADGIRCNSLHPGPISTPMGDAAMPPGPVREERLKAIPMARFGKPEEVAAAIAFLASDDASYITGSELVIDGGFTAT